MAVPVRDTFIFDTGQLVGVMKDIKAGSNFLLDHFFKLTQVFDSETISIDVDTGKRRISAFVSPLIQGKVVEARGYRTNTFKPAYIKDKRAPDLRRPVRRAIGEAIGGTLSPAMREAMNIEYEMTDQVNMLNRRMEWMAAQAMQTGAITVSGDGFPTTNVDFGRDPLLTKVLTGGATWTQANITAGTASPTGDLENWSMATLKSSGVRMTDVVFTTTAWQAFLLDPLIKLQATNPALGANYGLVMPTTPNVNVGAIQKPDWGQFKLWVYNDWYVDDNDVEQPMLAPGTVIMSNPEMLQGIRAYGIILDPTFNYAPMAYAPKTWIENDPAQRYLMMQSAPLLVPARPNASICTTVK